MLPEKGYLRVIVLVFYCALGIVGLYLFFRFLFPPLFPFIFAFIIASISRPTINLVSEKLHLPRKFTSVVLTVILVCLISSVLYVALSRLLYELVQLTQFLTSDFFPQFLEDISDRVTGFLQNLPGGKIGHGILSRIADRITHIDVYIAKVVKDFFPTLLDGIMKFLSFFPTALFSVILMFIALFYIGSDYERILAFFSIQFSGRLKNSLSETRKLFISTTSELFKAYFLITLITFAELFTGFVILNIRYSILFAAIIAIVDMLPILGTGTVLVPWGLICILMGNSAKGIGLLVIYGLITLIRQIIEPKIVGSSIGLYPLITLIAMYCGLRIMGFGGIFIFPIAVIIIKSLNERGIIHLYKNPTVSEKEQTEIKKKKFRSFRDSDK